MFSAELEVIIAAHSAAVTTVTPEDRSNSPPIMSRATPTATIPMVEEAYRTVANEGRVRNAGAIAKKKMKIAIAAATAPISGRVSTRAASDFLTGAGALGGLGRLRGRRRSGRAHGLTPVERRGPVRAGMR